MVTQGRRPQPLGRVFFGVGAYMGHKGRQRAVHIKIAPRNAVNDLPLGPQPKGQHPVAAVLRDQPFGKGCNGFLVVRPIARRYLEVLQKAARRITIPAAFGSRTRHFAADVPCQIKIEMVLQPASQRQAFAQIGLNRLERDSRIFQDRGPRGRWQIGAQLPRGPVFACGTPQVRDGKCGKPADQTVAQHSPGRDRRVADFRNLGIRHQILASPHDMGNIRIGDAPKGMVIAVILILQVSPTAHEGLCLFDGFLEVVFLKAQQGVVVNKGDAHRALFGQHVTHVVDMVLQLVPAGLRDATDAVGGANG